MKLQILREKTSFFVKLVWIQGVYATGDTLDEAMSNFWDVYKQAIELKKDFIEQKTKEISTCSWFKKLELSL